MSENKQVLASGQILIPVPTILNLFKYTMEVQASGQMWKVICELKDRTLESITSNNCEVEMRKTKKLRYFMWHLPRAVPGVPTGLFSRWHKLA